MRQRPAFTLIELIVALVLSTFVLVAIVGITSQMLRYEFEGTRKSVSTNWSLTAQDAIKKDIGSANSVYCPSNCIAVNNPAGCGGATGCAARQSTYLSGCGDYTFSPQTPFGAGPGPIDGKAQNVSSFYYCVQTAGTASGTPWLWRYTQGPQTLTGSFATCPHPVPGSCGAAVATSRLEVVAQDFYPYAANTWYFSRVNDMVEAQFMVGRGTVSVNGIPSIAVPTAQHVDGLRTSYSRSYGNSLD